MKEGVIIIKTGALRTKFNESLQNKVVCRNMLLISLSSMNNSCDFNEQQKSVIFDYLIDKGYSEDYIENITSQVDDKYFPTKVQINALLHILQEEHTFLEKNINNKLLKGIDNYKLDCEEGRVLKKFIYDTEQVETILDAIGCVNAKLSPSGDYWHCSNYDGDNKKAIIVKNTPYLGVTNYTRADFDNDRGDIITLVQYNLECSYKQAITIIRDAINGTVNGSLFIKSSDYKTKKIDKSNNGEEVVFDLSLLDSPSFKPVLHQMWIDDGITEKSRKRFNILYFDFAKQILIPHRRWYDGALLGFNRRTTIKDFERFGINKYMHTKKFKQSKNIFGLYENRNTIEKNGFCVIFESEKSVIKRCSYDDTNCVATYGKYISDEQINIITSLNIQEVILAFDKDVQIDEIKKYAKKFYGKKKVSYMYDSFGLLSEKESPADLPNKDYVVLFKNRIEYNENDE